MRRILATLTITPPGFTGRTSAWYAPTSTCARTEPT
eukprot:CAMPEP_0171773980 /NCGR_PEP_ID=MMETSP0991-20121206/55615_1 /TAXON_ID=483369 /ORGANISM="non described non described, Strain CCMP2098" /LENGTH=35 /DNA_ID= /DNA_START= /DNA_END= /DNA_ORIENTATION=